MTFASFVGSFLLVAAAAAPSPRPVSEAERGAVAVVAGYLASGADSVWTSLSSDAPLRALGKDAAGAEITARLGPAAKATWTLQTVVPSLAHRMAVFGVDFRTGGDDVVIFDMIEQNGEWKVRAIRTAAEPAIARRGLLSREAVRQTRRSNLDSRLPLVIALPGLLIGVMAVAIANQRLSRLFLAIAAAAVLTSTALLILPFIPRRTPDVPLSPDAPPTHLPAVIRIGSMASLREAFASGDQTPFAQFKPADQYQRDIARQWQAAIRIRDEQFAQARDTLASLTKGVRYSMAEILRARLAYLETKAVEAVAAYERAIEIGPGRDELWLEAAETLALLGFDERAEKYFDRAAQIGTREADVFYGLATRAGLQEKDQEAAKLLLTAWKMRPAERERVVGTPVLWRVIRLPAVANVLQLHSVEEAAFAGSAVLPLDLPAGSKAEVTGEHLRLHAREGKIDVPGGAAIAPANAVTLDAGAWRRREDEESLARFEELRAQATSSAAFADKGYRDRCVATSLALADRNRWSDLVALTDAFSPRDERVPLELMVLRGRALARLERTAELRPLIRDLLLNPSFRRKKDPAAMRLIAELLAAMDDYNSAIALMQRARNQMAMPGLEMRITQLEIERRLSSGYAVLKTDHFNIIYPPDTSRGSMDRLGEILESEYRRLQPIWFPGLKMKRVTVNVLWWEDFRLYSGSDYIAGLFTNEMFLPVAGLEEFSPEPVTIITHELTHAMLADATQNLAPRWFHEALASRVEMRDFSENGFLKYRDDRYLSVALLDAVADNSVDPDLIGEAYSLGESTLRFIEARYGRKAVQQMIASFRSGADTAQAVRTATGLSLAELDRAARGWGGSQPVLFEGSTLVRYDGREDRRGFGTW